MNGTVRHVNDAARSSASLAALRSRAHGTAVATVATRWRSPIAVATCLAYLVCAGVLDSRHMHNSRIALGFIFAVRLVQWSSRGLKHGSEYRGTGGSER
jgi:hypothetical protein